jgi:putative acetyltransferase
MEFCELRQFSFVAANTAGIALYEKFRFEIEGTHRRFTFRGGEYVDASSMARLT